MQTPTSRTPELYLSNTKDELEWLKEKLQIATQIRHGQVRTTKRGEVYGCSFGYNIGAELRDYHPCVVIQRDSVASNGFTVLVAPITHASNRSSIPHYFVPIKQQLDANGQILVEGYVNVAAMRSVSKARLTKFKALLSVQDMQAIDSEIATSLDLYHYHANCDAKLVTARKRADDAVEKIKKLRAALTAVAAGLPQEGAESLDKIIQDALAL